MRADSPVGLVMYNWLPYSFKASRNTAGILRRPFSSTLAGQLPRSVMCPVLDRPLDIGMARQQEEVVTNDRLHHTPLRTAYFVLFCPTALYCCPLCPTFVHIIGCFSRLSRGKIRRMRKKLSMDECGNLQQNTTTDCASGIARSLFVV